MNNELGVPVVAVSLADLNAHALMALHLIEKHPEEASEVITKFANGDPLPEGFLKLFALTITEFIRATVELRKQTELMRAQAEIDAVPKERLN